MTSLLELPTVRERVHRVSVADYHRAFAAGALPENVELLRGIIVNKMPKSPLHEFLAQKLMLVLLALLPKGFQLRPERPLTLRESEPEPDLSVVRGRPEDWMEAHPTTAELVIEVAVTSTEIDERKAEIYAEAGVPEYWLVRAEARTVDVFRQPSPDGYRVKVTFRDTDTLRCEAVPGIIFPLAGVFPARD